jgi:hypothetical protein
MARVTGHSQSGSHREVPFNIWTFADISAATGLDANKGWM